MACEYSAARKSTLTNEEKIHICRTLWHWGLYFDRFAKNSILLTQSCTFETVSGGVSVLASPTVKFELKGTPRRGFADSGLFSFVADVLALPMKVPVDDCFLVIDLAGVTFVVFDFGTGLEADA